MGLKQKNIEERINSVLCKHIERYNNTSSGSSCNSCTKDLIKLFSEALSEQKKEMIEIVENMKAINPVPEEISHDVFGMMKNQIIEEIINKIKEI